MVPNNDAKYAQMPSYYFRKIIKVYSIGKKYNNYLAAGRSDLVYNIFWFANSRWFFSSIIKQLLELTGHQLPTVLSHVVLTVMVMYGLKKVASGNQHWLFCVSIVLQLMLGGPQKVNTKLLRAVLQGVQHLSENISYYIFYGFVGFSEAIVWQFFKKILVTRILALYNWKCY